MDADTGEPDLGEPDAPIPTLCETDDRLFPAVSRSCVVDDDCVTVIHQKNCCGTEAAWGISATAEPAFTELEAICREQFNVCRCPRGATLADDGFALIEGAELEVRCQAGRCQSLIANPDPVVCGGTRPSVFPTFDRRCETVDDCAIVTHQRDCCGNSDLWGINASEVEAFEEAELECRSELDDCGCSAGVPITDTGLPADPPESVELLCQSGFCRTTAPLPPIDDFD